MKLFRKRLSKILASFVLVSILTQLGSPMTAFAITGGTAQPSNAGSPVGSSEMVDLFTGDFKYNIPLFELPGPDGGYPFSLNYNAGINMDQEASWVGLGWSLSPGAINRGLNGFPDEFKDEAVTVENDIKDNITVGATVSGDIEALGFELGEFVDGGVGLGLSRYYNNYRGMGFSIDPTISFDIANSNADENSLVDTTTLGLDFGFDSQEGFNFSPSLTLTDYSSSQDGLTRTSSNFSIGASYNTNEGLSSVRADYDSQTRYYERVLIPATATSRGELLDVLGGTDNTIGGGAISLVRPSYSPSIGTPMHSVNASVAIKAGGSIFTIFPNLKVGGYYSQQSVRKKYENHPLNAYGYFNFHENIDDEKASLDFNREKDASLTKFTENLAIPSVTNDNFVVSGAGIGGVFRAFRNDLGVLHDARTKSHGESVNIAFDAGANKFGVTGGGGYSETIAREWRSAGQAMKDFNYDKEESFSNDADYEPYYLKMKGEHTPINENDLDYIGNEQVVSLNLESDFTLSSRDFGISAFEITPQLRNKKGTVIADAENHTFGNERRVKGTVITHPKVEDIFNDNGESVLPEYNIQNAYREKKNHPAGYTILPTSGVKYVYGLPVYNTKKIQCSYSTDHTFIKTEGTGTTTFDLDEFSLKADIIRTSDGNELDADDDEEKPKYKYRARQQRGKSNEYFKRTTTPAYASSYLLTSLLGTDYVDITSDGPSEDDLGYWVNFDYDKTTSSRNPYKWRAPFSKSMFNEGTDKQQWADNTASYTYGEREMFYMERVSTKTHVAEFKKSVRHDARGVQSEFQNSTDPSTLGEASYKLDQIDLYTRVEYKNAEEEGRDPIPLKTVHFEYTYDLCGGVDNNDHGVEPVTRNDVYGNEIETRDINSNHGKLTLKRLYFTYRGNTRGMINPYEFDYNEDKTTDGDLLASTQNAMVDGFIENPDYTEFMNDKWGMYSYRRGLNNFLPSGGDDDDREKYNNQLNNYKYPYTHQPAPMMDYPSDYSNHVIETGWEASLEDQRREQDNNRSVWNLKAIDLPSGARLEIKYEADDYAYVHDQPAMEMFKILGFDDGNNNINQDIHHGEKGDQKDANRIYFRLKEEIDNTDAAKDKAKEAYFKDFENLYFNVDLYLKEEGDVSHTITGWADVADSDAFGFGTDGDDNTKLNYGWVRVKKEKSHYNKKDKKAKYHPISFAAWQYMSNYMNRYVTGGNVEVSDDANDDEKGARVKAMLSGFTSFGQMFRGLYAKAKAKGWSTHVKLDRSYIRLYNPSKKKIGGGCRVKQVALYDNWDQQAPGEQEAVYGQVYDYTTIENGEEISSGVAAYEPLAGGDENPMRRVKSHEVKKRMKLNEEVNFLYPINEHMYPVPMVGYSKVNVKSLATHYEDIEGEQETEGFDIPNDIDIMTSGAVEHEFYTTKDFPFISEETNIESKNFPFVVPNPIAAVNIKRYYATQGYQMTTNDMHGKSKKITYLEQLENGAFKSDNAPYVEYTYKTKNKTFYDGFDYRTVKVLDNKVDVLESKYGGEETVVGGETFVSALTEEKLIGVDWDVSLDTRESYMWRAHAAPKFNLDAVIWPLPPAIIPLPGFMPGIKYTEKVVKTAVINKVFYKHGILEEVKAFDGQATIVSRDQIYDNLTGRPVLSTVTNQFDEQIYQYSPSLHLEYEGASAAYENIGMSFDANVTFKESKRVNSEGNIGTSGSFLEESLFEATNINGISTRRLIPGDEFAIGANESIIGKATYLKKLPNGAYLFSSLHDIDDVIGSNNDIGSTLEVNFLLIRSGKRNLLASADETLVSKTNPLVGIGEDECNANYVKLGTAPQLVWNQPYDKIEAVTEAYLEALRRPNQWYFIPTNSAIFEDDFYNSSGRKFRKIIFSYNTSNGRSTFILDDNEGGLDFSLSTTTQVSQEFIDAVLRNDEISYANIRIHTFVNEYRFDIVYSYQGEERLQELYSAYNNVSKEVETPLGIQSTFPSYHKTLNNILAIGASPLTDVNYYSDQINSLNPYRSGEKGIWRSNESYAYVQDRIQMKNDEKEVNLRASGHMDNVTLFDPQNYLLSTCSPQWRKVSEITKYNADGYQVESKDILGIYSSALYDSESEQMIAMAANAREDEVLFEDFEDNKASGGNFEYSDNRTLSRTFYDCEGFDVISGGGKKAIVKMPYDPDWGDADGEREVKIAGALTNFYANKNISGSFKAKMLPLYEGTNIKEGECVLSFEDDPAFNVTGHWAGKITVCELELPSTGDIDYLGSLGIFAHTGKSSLQLQSRNTRRELVQLDLEPNKVYSLSVWCSLGENSGQTYSSFAEGATSSLEGGNNTIADAAQITISYTTITNSALQSAGAFFTPSGRIINDWQQINGEFQLPEDVKDVVISFDVSFSRVDGSVVANDTYYDDLRICPKDAEMVTYVYDKDFYRLMSQLDDRNYATFYHYDDKGTAYTTRIETSRGIRTLTDARGHATEK